MVDVLRFTRRRWGDAQAYEYRALINEALSTIAGDPSRGKPDDLLPGLLAFAIRQPGRPARHILFYRVDTSGAVEILRLLHDAMAFAQHLG
jgi:plasmid stabilization system protein ParE